MTPAPSALARLKYFLFGDEAPEASLLDVCIILLLLLFLFSSTLSIAAMSITYGAAALLWVVKRIVRRESLVPATPLDRFILAYIGAALLSLAFAFDKNQALLYTYRRLSLLPIIYVMFDTATSRRLLKLLLASILTSMVIAALWSCRDVVVHFHEYITFQRRSNVFQMYMTAGGMMMFGGLLLLPFIAHAQTPRKVRWVALVSMIPIGVNLLFTFTRSSWLGFLAGALVIAAMRARKIVLPLVGIVAAVVVLASPEMQDRMASIFNPYHPNNVTRLQMWTVGIRIFLDKPIVGVGDIGIEKVWSRYADPGWEPAGHLHNNMLLWLATLGIIGFVVLVALFVKLWREVRAIEKNHHNDWFIGSLSLGCLAAMAGFHVNGLFEWNFGDAEIMMLLWSLVGLTFAAKKVASVKPGNA